MMFKIIAIEKELVVVYSTLLFLLNIMSIYFLIKLLNHEMISDNSDYMITIETHEREIKVFLIITTLSNLLFLSVYLINKTQKK